MLVEDEYIIAMSYEASLKKAGFDVSRTIDTGEEAIDTVLSLNPDLILMDIKLKGSLDGIEAARQILKIRKLPIIFMTGNSDIETKNRALALNPVDYMNKPIVLKNMVEKIRQVLG
jgi:two-component system, response regulator PdtaR